MKTKTIRYYVDLWAGWQEERGGIPVLVSRPQYPPCPGTQRFHVDIQLPCLEAADEGKCAGFFSAQECEGDTFVKT